MNLAIATAPDNIVPLPVEPDPIIPPELNTERFRIVWNKWVKHRRSLKKPKGGWPDFFKDQLEWLVEYGEEAAYNTVRFSYLNRYQGLFPEKFNRAGATHSLSGIDKTILYDELKRLEKKIPALRDEMKYHPDARTRQELSLCRIRADEIRAKLGIKQ